MSEALEKLKSIGVEKIYETTHIPVSNLNAIINESFEGLHKVQFMGFISILEREYHIDLSDLRSGGELYFDEHTIKHEVVDDDFFTPVESKKKRNIFFIILALIALIVALFYTTESANKKMDLLEKKESVSVAKVATIEPTKNATLLEENSTSMSSVVVKNDENESNETNTTNEHLKTLVEDKADENLTSSEQLAQEADILPKQENIVPKSFKIVARQRVWLGYIDLATGEKHQKIFSGELRFNPKKERLFYFGHGNVNVVINGKVEEFHGKKRLRLHYLDGKIEKIDLKSFKRLNRGKGW